MRDRLAFIIFLCSMSLESIKSDTVDSLPLAADVTEYGPHAYRYTEATLDCSIQVLRKLSAMFRLQCHIRPYRQAHLPHVSRATRSKLRSVAVN